MARFDFAQCYFSVCNCSHCFVWPPGRGCTVYMQAIHCGKKQGGPVCLGCGAAISEDTKALQCDGCGGDSAWKCIDCLNITSELYDLLMANDGPELRWLCEVCDHSVAQQSSNNRNLDRLEELIDSMSKLMSKLCSIESRMDDKADVDDVKGLKDRLLAVEERMQHMDSDIEACKKGKQIDDMKVMDCVEKVMSERVQDTNSEEAEVAKRKTNVIVHGLPESEATEVEERESDDAGQVSMLLYELKCDSAEVSQFVRLGSRDLAAPDGTTRKPRPVKLVLKTEEQKLDILRNSKNLRWREDGGWKSVFIHADLTLKQREVRRKLVSEMKTRKENGETDLIIVNGRIVKKW